jgi:hypothetical protein
MEGEAATRLYAALLRERCLGKAERSEPCEKGGCRLRETAVENCAPQKESVVIKSRVKSKMESIAAGTLRKARFFVEQIRRADTNDRDTITIYLESAIVFARSVTFHLQSQFAHILGFKEWYEEQQRRLGDDPLSRFLLQQRNYVLKEGPAPVNRVIGISIAESVILYPFVLSGPILGTKEY